MNDPAKPVPRPGAQSIERAMGLVNLVARHHDPGINLQSLVQLSGLDRTTAWRMLGSLQHAGLVERDEHSGLYRLGVQATAAPETRCRHSGVPGFS